MHGRWPVLMRTIGDLSLIRERVSPFTSVSGAVLKMQEHGLRVLPVVEDGAFRGIVSRDQTSVSAPDAPVKDIVQTLVIEMPASTPVRAAARLFVENGLDCVPVVENGEFIGLLTANQLLIELGRSWDPMTGLSWSDRLRDWGVEALESGREVTIAFIDLNDFGAYNKAHGHIVGDRVLRAVAQRLASVVAGSQDVLVRYGGDEFVLGTLRPREELESQLMQVTREPVAVEGVPDPVGYTVGFAGGKRTRERERVHFASTLDNLINLASQDCLSKKPSRPNLTDALDARPAVRTRSVLVETDRLADSVQAVASVALDGYTALAVAVSDLNDALGAAAAAVCQALAKLRPELRVKMDDVVVYRRWDSKPVAFVTATIEQRQNRFSVQATGTSDHDVYTALGEALVTVLLRADESLSPLARSDD